MDKKKTFMNLDGNTAASHIAYMFSEVACIYPITPSSTMAELIDEWSANGRKNIFDEEVKVVEMQSEAGAAGAVHGSLQTGALTTTYTASQGLLLMIPNMYKMAGELLPAVFHVSARTVASHALSIFGDHSDVYAARQTGFALLASGSVQEVMDLASVAHLTAIKTRVPFLHFFDGFRTSHEIQKVEAINKEDLINLVDKEALQKFRDNALNPEHPVTRGTAQNPDIFFQAKEAVNRFYDNVPEIVEEYMKEITKITGREYLPFQYYGDENAERIIIAMGSVTETIKETIDFLMKQGQKVGLIIVHLYRPFSTRHLLRVVPKTVKSIAVLDRTKELGANGEPLYLDIKEVFYGYNNAPTIVGGRYGLSSKDTTPAQIISVFNNLNSINPKNGFTIGIIDDVTYKSLPLLEEIDTTPEGTFSAKFFGLGSDGTVSANKNSIKIIGDCTDKYTQGYFAYDSKKSGGITVSHLRFGDQPIRSTYFVKNSNFVACHVPSYINKYDMLSGLKKGGTFLFNSIWDEKETLEKLPDHMKKYLATNDINFYIINATKIAEEVGLGTITNTIMQSAFFKVSEVIPFDLAIDEMKKAAKKSYGKKGEEVVNKNYKALEEGSKQIHKVEIPKEWKDIVIKEDTIKKDQPEFITNVCDVINHFKGDDLKVSAFLGREDGTFDAGTTKYEKRGIAVNVPQWQKDTCIQCNQCAYVCPHAVIRPFLIDEEEMKNLPEGVETVKALGPNLEKYQFRIQISPLDCTGCGNCADVCPAPKGKALVMKPLETQKNEAKIYDHFEENVTYKDILPKTNVKNSQFLRPLFEFSGACAGCGETPYIKLITQLYGDRMVVANATGCSSIYGGSAPATPYRKNEEGKGVAWANSLFEDNAEYGLGMSVAIDKLRDRIERLMKKAIEEKCCESCHDAFNEWIENKNHGENSKLTSKKVLEKIKDCDCDTCKEIYKLKDYLVKKSVWIIGGDGWAYDIGYGGLDHVIASGSDVNILVVDTEVYSNTGGQSSKATPTGAIAKFAASGKKIRKKDLGMMAMSYGYVYVAQVAMGANQAQYFKAVKEAEEYDGPSLIIAYAPCINHGLKCGMGKSQDEEKRAVESGYWQLYRYNPTLENEGKNPFVLDSKEPNFDKFDEFIDGEVRYSSLKKTFPHEAEVLFKAAKEDAKYRYNKYKRLAEMKYE